MSTLVPAGQGRALRMSAGQRLRVVTIEGSQVVDTWALTLPRLDEWLSMEHTRGLLMTVSPRAGDRLFSDRRRPILRLLEDTSPGIHDTLIPACDQERYTQLGHDGPHRNCVDNFRSAVSDLGLVAPAVPAPLNLFMNVPISASRTLDLQPSPAAPGDSVTLEAMIDVLVVLSACPQDMVPINGEFLRPTDVAVYGPE